MKKKEVLNPRIVISGFSGVLFVCPGVFGVLLYLLGFRDLTLQSMDGIVVLYDRVFRCVHWKTGSLELGCHRCMPRSWWLRNWFL